MSRTEAESHRSRSDVSSTPQPPPLAGVRVLDFSQLLPGPLATLIMAEAGANVLRIEKPGGDELRESAVRLGRSSTHFALVNRGKRSVALDLKSAGAVERITPLLETADILVEQFRPGVMDRLGLGYEAVARHNPGIIYCSITGYGQTGARAQRPGHDLNYAGAAGVLDLFSSSESPMLPAGLLADVGGGAYPAVINILLALRAREHTGSGTHLDIAMAENLFPFVYWAFGEGQIADWPRAGQHTMNGGSPRWNQYATKDGRLAVVAALEQRFWDNLCDVLDLDPGDRDDESDPQRSIAAVADRIGSQTAEYWSEQFDQADCCTAIAASLEEATADPHFAARGLFDRTVVSASSGATMGALPVPLAPTLRTSAATLAYPELTQADDQTPLRWAD